MLSVLYFYAFIIGICIASFINVVIYRVPLSMSVAKGRSFCPNCSKKLVWYDLIPIVSYLFLKGKCRYCGVKIPVKDTLVELIGGLVAMYCFYHYQFQWDTIIVFSIFMILLAITIIDFDTMTIPNGLLLILIIPVILYASQHLEITLINRIIGTFAISLPLLLLIKVIPDSFGGGDVKLFAVGGFLLGWERIILAAFLGILVCGVYVICLLVLRCVKRGQHIAFGPYISLGIMISLLYGYNILEWYGSFFIS